MPRPRSPLAVKVDEAARDRARALAVIDRASLPASASATLARDWVATLPNAGTAKTYAHAITEYLGWCSTNRLDPASVTGRDAKRYLVSLHALAPGTQALRCAAVRTFYEEAIDEDIAPGNPFRKVRPKSSAPIEPTPALREAEWEAVLDGPVRDAADPYRAVVSWRDFTIIYVGGRVGLRRIELIRLTWSSLRARAGESLLMVHGKGDTWVPLALPADVSDALRSWRTVCEEALGRAAKPSEPIFPVVGRSPAPGLDNSGSMVRLDPRSMTRLVANRAVDAGLDGPRFAAHALRATAATLAYHHGADVLRIQAMLRHASLSTTQLYVKRAQESRGSAAGVWQPRPRPAASPQPAGSIS